MCTASRRFLWWCRGLIWDQRATLSTECPSSTNRRNTPIRHSTSKCPTASRVLKNLKRPPIVRRSRQTMSLKTLQVRVWQFRRPPTATQVNLPQLIVSQLVNRKPWRSSRSWVKTRVKVTVKPISEPCLIQRRSRHELATSSNSMSTHQSITEMWAWPQQPRSQPSIRTTRFPLSKYRFPKSSMSKSSSPRR